ncbi:MAG: iron-sulfur cluster insertion protein ErpA [Mariprofundaceae bacterium]|nr:iron-sulfur cluster insertion protein ErpA [Mariprofundaceae bacterium]
MSLTLTESAANRIQNLLEQEQNSKLGLRIFVNGGGCSGFQYGFSFDEEKNNEDIKIDSHGVHLLVDPMSLKLLDGSEVDYKETTQGASFVIKNPNAGSTCGCGKSFTPAESGAGCGHTSNYQ